jgi:hypothetical protein
MSRRTRSAQRPLARGFAVAGIVLLSLCVGVLAVMAYEHGNPELRAQTADPAPVFTLGVDVSATPSTTPATAPESPHDERFLTIGASAWWRASSPPCGEGEPLLERSTDAGASWTDVTPRYLDVRQVLSLSSFDGSEAEMVVARGEGCAIEGLRTFTQGEFWSAYPEVLAASTYLDAAGGSVVHRRGTEVPAPCADPHGLQTSGDVMSVVCDGRALALTEAGWWTSPTVGVVDAAPSNGLIAVAARTEECAGIEVFLESPANSTSDSLACVAADPTETALTTSPTDGRIVLWADDAVTTAP